MVLALVFVLALILMVVVIAGTSGSSSVEESISSIGLCCDRPGVLLGFFFFFFLRFALPGLPKPEASDPEERVISIAVGFALAVRGERW